MARKTEKVRTDDREQVSAALEKAFDARAIIYATSTREPAQLFGAQVATDVLPLLGEHLDLIGDAKRIALVLHTRGGQLETPWPLVNMLRSHCKELLVLVPEIALSAGTLIALGADRIFMAPHSFLSAVDPTNTRTIDGKAQNISIEDVIGYIDFITDRVGIRDQEALVSALKELTSEVKATVLGSVHRTRSLIERLSTNLLHLHLRQLKDRKRVEQIVDFLTHSLFAHNHLIPPTEAKFEIGFGNMIVIPNEEQLTAIRAAHKLVLSQLQCRETFDPEAELGPGSAEKTIVSKRAILVSRDLWHEYVSKYRISKTDQKLNVQPIGAPAWIRGKEQES